MHNLRVIKSQGHMAPAVTVMFMLLAVWVGPGLASAHAALTSSTPAAGSTVSAGLTQIVLNFSEETSVDQSTGEVQGGNGAIIVGVSVAVDRIDRKKMVITTPALGAGTYTVKWKSVTEDDNGIENGSFTFTVVDKAPATTPTPVATEISGQSGTGGTGTTTNSLPVAGAPATSETLTVIVLMAFGMLVAGLAMVRRAMIQV